MVGGSLLLAVGTIGWLLPILPGWIFIIPGLMLLGQEFHWARRTLAWIKSRLPKKSYRTDERAGD